MYTEKTELVKILEIIEKYHKGIQLLNEQIIAEIQEIKQSIESTLEQSEKNKTIAKEDILTRTPESLVSEEEPMEGPTDQPNGGSKPSGNSFTRPSKDSGKSGNPPVGEGPTDQDETTDEGPTDQ